MNKKIKFISAILFISCIAVALFIFRKHCFAPTQFNKISETEYKSLCVDINFQHDSIQIAERKKWLMHSFSDILIPHWIGTKWDFNGTTEIPNQGKIACGYFVTTIVRDLGFDINRIKLAQCASEEMITTFIEPERIYRFNQNNTMIQFLQNHGENLYIVGLDNHTGFILNNSEETYFIHSSGRFPYCVIKQKLKDAQVLLNSKYKVVGCLTESKKIWSL